MKKVVQALLRVATVVPSVLPQRYRCYSYYLRLCRAVGVGYYRAPKSLAPVPTAIAIE